MNASNRTVHQARPRRTWRIPACNWIMAAVLATSPSMAAAFDVFGVEADVPPTPAGRAPGWAGDCGNEPMGRPLRLREAVKTALCNNPRTQEAWASIKVQAAALGLSRSSYLPSLNASAQSALNDATTSVAERPELGSSARRTPSTQTLALDWVLYDFGRRDADVRNSEFLLAAAQANHRAVVMDVISDVARAYFAAQSAEAAWMAAQEVEATARTSFEAAAGRVRRGVAPVSDELQTQTAMAEDELQSAKAQSDLKIALGVLATSIGLVPDSAIELPEITVQDPAARPAQPSVSELIQRAQAGHPRILQAAALRDAAIARVDQARADRLPSVSVKAIASHDNAPVTSLGSPLFPARTNDRSLAVTVSVPLFDGFGRDYKLTQALRQVEVEEAHVASARQQIAADIWSGYHAVRSAETSLGKSAALLSLSQRAYEVAKERYQTGVGPISDLLAAQLALSSAQRRRLQAATDWHSARWVLLARLGFESASDTEVDP